MTRHEVPGTELTTLAVGGACRTVIDVTSEAELLQTLTAHPNAIVIGGGSNLLISDDGYAGVLVRSYAPGAHGIDIDADAGTVTVDAPVDWDALVAATIAAGLQGLEATSGVPGSLGGAIVQNLGAYGQETADVVESVDVWDRSEQRRVTFSKDECDFSYRESRFKHDRERRYVVTSARLTLKRTDEAVTRYGDVSALLAERYGHAGPYPLADIRQAVLDVRTGKGMVLGASLPSAGSFFTNPVLDEDAAVSLASRGLKVIERPDGTKLTSAAALLEEAGFRRGHRRGRAGLSDRHVLALVNCGDARTRDIVDLAIEIRDTVLDRLGVTLTPEPVMLGFAVNPFDVAP